MANLLLPIARVFNSSFELELIKPFTLIFDSLFE